MVDPGSYEALLAGDEPGGRIRWSETHASACEGQLLAKDMRVTLRGSLVVGVLASGG